MNPSQSVTANSIPHPNGEEEVIKAYGRLCLELNIALDIRLAAAPEANESLRRLIRIYSHLLPAISKMFARGQRSLYIYGAGAHTRDLLTLYPFNDYFTVKGILDDMPHTNNLSGIPVLSPKIVHFEDDDAVLISSDSIEDKLYTNGITLLHDPEKVFTLYRQNVR